MNNDEMTPKRDRARSVLAPTIVHNTNIKKSNICLIYICIVSVLVSELAISLYLYTYINNHTYVNKINIHHEIENILRENLRKASVRNDIGEIIRNYIAVVEKDAARRESAPTSTSIPPSTTSGATSTITEPPAIKVSITNKDNDTIDDTFRYSRKKRDASVLEDNTVTQGAVDDGKHVEFFNPKLRQELEAKDEVEKRRTGLKGAAPGGDNWVWLTSYSRIPYNAIEGFCKATREYCPPGRPGAKGSQGERGYPGASGLPGQRGEIGWPGNPGLDGRDGIPGEPGLDGLPGRSGADGIPGLDGTPGRDGVNGKDGANGIDGRPGLTGPQGPPGPQGPRGLSGPRGRPGRPGSDGTPGIPGVQSWKITANGTEELLIPPSISGGAHLSPIIVHEGENLRLRCAASGTPRPDVEWRRTDGKVISMGSWQASSIPGHTLNITHINREHMGNYQCTANNGIPPVANQTFQLEVHFPPLIKIRNQRIGVANGSTAVMECEVEAFPEALRYWERSDSRLLEHGDKYRIETENHGYRSLMRLNVTRATSRDCTLYHCIAKNEMGITRGVFTVFEIDPSLSTPPPTKADATSSRVAVYGERPPEKVSLDDLCPAPTVCPECPDPKDFKCKDAAVSLFDLVGHLEIRPLGNATYPGLPNRTLDCLLYAVGKPVYHRFTDEVAGAWMRDSSPRNDIVAEKLWATREEETTRLYEYNNKTVFRRDQPSRVYELQYPFRGNSHVVYNGSFYYHERNGPRVMRFDLASERYAGNLNVPLVSADSDNFLYTTGLNYIDFSVDDNGLWLIFGIPSSNNTAVIKLDHETMQAQYMWNISVNHHKVGEMFIVCGVLYAVDSVTDRDTTIRLALDLYRNILHYPELTFTNPFRRTTMIGYNHRSKELYTWDKGNQLTYPVRYHEIGYNITDKDQKDETLDGARSQMQTGFDVYPQDN